MGHQPLVLRFARRAAVRSEWVYGRGYQGPSDAAVFAELASRQPLWAGMRVLEIGSGLGGDAFRLAEWHGAHVVGIDSSPDMTALARQRAAEAGIEATEFRTADARSFTPPDRSFDLVWSRDCFMYLTPVEKRAVWTVLHTGLRPGGRVLVTDYGRGAPGCSERFEQLHRDSEYNLVTASQQVEILVSVGFVAVSVEDATSALLQSMRMERDRLVNEAEDFLASFSSFEHDQMVRRWDRKISAGERHELTWQIVTARRDTNG